VARAFSIVPPRTSDREPDTSDAGNHEDEARAHCTQPHGEKGKNDEQAHDNDAFAIALKRLALRVSSSRGSIRFNIGGRVLKIHALTAEK
jgi:hypothetical protein